MAPKLFLLLSFLLQGLLCAENTYELTAVAIFQNEAPYLQEWIEYHRIIGVEHFTLFNNLSQDDCLEVLKPYIEQGVVELVDWPKASKNLAQWNAIQSQAYFQGLSSYKERATWTLLIDIDEFVVPKTHDTLTAYLKDFSQHACLAINWQMFGTSHIATLNPQRPLIEQLTHKAPPHFSENRFVKFCVKPDQVLQVRGPHKLLLRKNQLPVDEHHRPCPKGMTKKVSIDTIQLNHYWSRDETFYFHHKLPRQPQMGNWYAKMQAHLAQLNLTQDFTIQKYLPKLAH